MKKQLELYQSLRHPDSDVKWAASRVLLNSFIKGKSLPASVVGMAFNIINGRAFDLDEEQKVRNISQDYLDKAIAAGIETVATIDGVIKDLKNKEPIVRILAIENLVIACEYDNDISRAVPALEKALKDPDLGVRRNAAFVFLIMGEHGYDISGSVKVLKEAEKDEDPEVRKYAGKIFVNFRKKGNV